MSLYQNSGRNDSESSGNANGENSGRVNDKPFKINLITCLKPNIYFDYLNSYNISYENNKIDNYRSGNLYLLNGNYNFKNDGGDWNQQGGPKVVDNLILKRKFKNKAGTIQKAVCYKYDNYSKSKYEDSPLLVHYYDAK